MLRSGFILSVSGPAAILTLLVQPTVRETADRWIPVAAVSAPVLSLPGQRTASTSISPIRVAAIPSAGSRSVPASSETGRTASEKDAVKVRRPMQEGCERPISSLAGPEARRMLAGRCMT